MEHSTIRTNFIGKTVCIVLGNFFLHSNDKTKKNGIKTLDVQKGKKRKDKDIESVDGGGSFCGINVGMYKKKQETRTKKKDQTKSKKKNQNSVLMVFVCEKKENKKRGGWDGG